MNENAKIIIVEDERIVAKDIQQTLHELGYAVPEIARSGKGAVQASERLNPDLVLMDIVIDGHIDGIEAAKDIRHRLNIPVVFLTAHSEESTIERAKQANPYGYIVKPYEKRELRSTIEMALHKREMEQRIEHLNAVLKAVRNVNQLITHENNRQQLLQKTCNSLIETRGYFSAWIAYLDAPKPFLKTGEHHTTVDYAPLKEMWQNGTLPPCAKKALHSADVGVIADTSQCESCLFKQSYQQPGSLAKRLSYNEHNYGVLSVSMPADLVSDKEEHSLFNEVCDDIAYALHSIEQQESSQKSEERYENLFENMGDAVAVYEAVDDGQDFVFRDFNKSAELIDGINRKDVIGKRVTKVFPGVKKIGLFDVFQRVWKTGQSEHLPASFYKDNRIRGWRENFVYRLSTGEIVSVYEDITERKQAEQELRWSEERFREIFHNTNDALFLHTVSEGKVPGKFVEVNNVAIDRLGYTRDEFLNMTPADIDAQKLQKDVPAIMNELFENNHATFEMYHVAKDGTKIPVEINSHLFTLGGEKMVLSVARDIRDRKKAEAEKEEMHKQLLQAQKMEAIGTLAGGVAHDFNNALTVILGHAQIAVSGLESSNPQYTHIKQILNSANHAANLTRQLLLFSRKQEIMYETININNLLIRLLKMIQRLIGEDIKIETAFDPDLWNNYADAGQIEQVITNLAVNARDAMPEGGTLRFMTQNVELSKEKAALTPDAKPGKYVRLDVKDTGTGINQDVADKIFEPFFSTKEVNKGTGMGLSVVLGIIRKHEGWIDVDSEPGKGTTFAVYLPAYLGKSEDSQNRGENKFESGELSGQGEGILVVEDDKNVMDYINNVLSSYGYNVFQCENAEHALETYQMHNENIQVVLSDLVLPKKNGLEMADQLKKEHNDVKIILSSGYIGDRVKQIELKEKGYMFVQKPYKPNQLLKLLKELLSSE